MAARLSEDPQVTVALLDAGPAATPPWADCPAAMPLLTRRGGGTSVVQPGLNGRSAYLPQAPMLGGASSIHAMLYSRGDPSGYDRWAVDNPGWGYADMRPYFARVESALQVQNLPQPSASSAAFVAAAGQADWPHAPHFSSTSPQGIGLAQVMQHAGMRTSAASAYLAQHLQRPNLQRFTGVQAMRVLLRGRRATGVEFGQDGLVKQLDAARAVLLCAGALQSPQLLLLSGIGPHAVLLGQGVATRHDLPGVGQQLQDQVAVAQIYHAPRAPGLLGWLRLAQGALQWRKTRTGPLTSNWWEAGGCVASQPDATEPDLHLGFAIGKLLDHGRPTLWGRGFTLQARVLRPASRGSVQLASKDPFAAPLVDPNLLGQREDLECLQRGLRLLRHIAQQPALAALGARESRRSALAQADLPLETFIRDHAQASGHWTGSCRMGPGPLDVVDAQLRVHGVQGLRVVDASVLPCSMGDGTQAAVLALAEKAADLLRVDNTGG